MNDCDRIDEDYNCNRLRRRRREKIILILHGEPKQIRIQTTSNDNRVLPYKTRLAQFLGYSGKKITENHQFCLTPFYLTCQQ